jgi:hypothetical protein
VPKVVRFRTPTLANVRHNDEVLLGDFCSIAGPRHRPDLMPRKREVCRPRQCREQPNGIRPRHQCVPDRASLRSEVTNHTYKRAPIGARLKNV